MAPLGARRRRGRRRCGSPRGGPLHRRAGPGHGRLQPLPRGAVAHVRTGRRASRASSVLDTTDPDCDRQGRGGVRPRAHHRGRRVQVGLARSRPGRTWSTSGPGHRSAGSSSRSPIPGRDSRRSRPSAASARSLHGDPEIGGRFSALSAFGMVPAALMGTGRHARCWTPPRRRSTSLGPDTPVDEHLGAQLGALMAVAARAGGTSSPSTWTTRIVVARVVARAAHRRVDRQARRRASCRCSTSRPTHPTPTVGCTSLIGDADVDLGAARRTVGPPAGRGARGPGRPGRAVGVRDDDRRHRAGDQPLRPARRRVGQARGTRRARGRRHATGDGRRSTRRSRCCAPGDALVIGAFVDPALEPRLQAARRELGRRAGVATTLGLGPTVPALDRSAAQGRRRPPRRAAGRRDTDDRRRRSRASRSPSVELDPRAGRRRPGRAACRGQPCRAGRSWPSCSPSPTDRLTALRRRGDDDAGAHRAVVLGHQLDRRGARRRRCRCMPLSVRALVGVELPQR